MEVRNIDSFLSYFESIRKRTLRVLRAAPPDKLEWRHSESVFSMGDLARHIAEVERNTFGENVFGRPSRYRGCGPELADGLENIVAFMEQMHEQTRQLLAPLTPADIEGKGITPEG